MTDKPEILCIIPARGGSKRLPGKNIMEIAGKPLIAWTIEAGLKSDHITRLVVSTDNKEIAEISRSFGAEVPFIRPEHLARDSTGSFQVIEQCLDYFKKNEQSEFEYIILLQPTSPLRQKSDINEAFNLLFSKKGKAIISVCETEHSPLWSNTIEENLSMVNFLNKDIINTQSRFLPKYYRLNGAIYIYETKSLLKEKQLFLNENIYAYKMSKKNSIDIDDQIDFDLAELYLKNFYH